MLCSKYRNFINYASGLAVIQTMRPMTSTSVDAKEFHCIAILDLDGFLASFTDSDQFADALAIKARDIVNEWWADNAARDKQGVRVPIERAYKLTTHTWRGRKKQEYSMYDLQLSSWGFTQTNLHCEVPQKMLPSDVRYEPAFFFYSLSLT